MNASYRIIMTPLYWLLWIKSVHIHDDLKLGSTCNDFIHTIVYS